MAAPDVATRHAPTASTVASLARATAALEALPLAFEPVDAGEDRFVVRGGTAAAGVRRDGLTVVDGADGKGRIDISFGGAQARGRLDPDERLPGLVHYVRGAKREDWRIGVPRFARVRGHEIYAGIDVEYYGTRQHLEYDFIVRAGADPGRIELSVAAAQPVMITGDGDLALRTGTVIQKKPIAFQTIAGVRRGVDASYVERAAGTFGIDVGAYDPALPLVIDPVVVYAFSNLAPGAVTDMATDSTGALYLVGTAFWADLPGGGGACSPVPCTDGFVYKLNRAGTDLEFATFLVGSQQDDLTGIALDGAANVYVAGRTTSNDFPGAAQPGIVVARLAPDGSAVLNTQVQPVPVGSTFEEVLDFAVSVTGEAYAWVHLSTGECDDAGLLRAPAAGALTWFDYQRSCVGFVPAAFAVAVGSDQHVYTSLLRQAGASLDGAFVRRRPDATTVYELPQVLASAIAIAPDGSALIGYANQLRSIDPAGAVLFTSTLPPDAAQWPVSRFAHVGVDAAGTILALRCGQWVTPTPGSECVAFRFDQAGTLAKWELLNEQIAATFTSDARGMLYAASESFAIRKYSFATAAFVSPPATAPAGTPITWEATTSLAGSLEFAFWKHTAATGWVLVQPYGASRNLTWTPQIGDIGTHNLQVFVREVGSPHPYDTWAGTKVQIVSPALSVNAFGASPSTGFAGVPVTFSVTASGGIAPLQYQFWRLQAGSWQIVQPYSASSTYTWTPGIGDVGTHSLQVWVRNAGSVALYDAWRGLSFTVATPPPVTITSFGRSAASPMQAGSPITWTAAASGGTGTLHYQFWRLDADGWKVAQAYGPASTYSWTPGAGDAGDRVLQVWVRAAGSVAPYETWRADSFSVVAAPVTTPVLTVNTNVPLQVGQTVTWTAASTGGAGALEYQFWRLDGAVWTMVQNYSTSPTFTWTISVGDVGTHALQVWVRSTGAPGPYQAWSGTGAFVVNP